MDRFSKDVDVDREKEVLNNLILQNSLKRKKVDSSLYNKRFKLELDNDKQHLRRAIHSATCFTGGFYSPPLYFYISNCDANSILKHKPHLDLNQFKNELDNNESISFKRDTIELLLADFFVHYQKEKNKTDVYNENRDFSKKNYEKNLAFFVNKINGHFDNQVPSSLIHLYYTLIECEHVGPQCNFTYCFGSI